MSDVALSLDELRALTLEALLANGFDSAGFAPQAVREAELKAMMDKALEDRPVFPDVGLRAAA